VAHGAILLLVAAYSCKCTLHTSVADAAGESSERCIFRHENGDCIYKNNFDGVAGGRRNRLQTHREKQIRALLLGNEGEVEPSKPDHSSVDKTRSLSRDVKGPRKVETDVVQEDDLLAMGDKKEKKKMGKSWDASEHGKDGYVCVKYALPKSGKMAKGSGKSGKKGGNSKGAKIGGSNGGVDHDPNWERYRALLSEEKRNEKKEGQEPNEADKHRLGRKETREKKIDDKEDLKAIASWNEEQRYDKKKKKYFDEPNEEAVCVKWKLIPEVS
jgi:hypothetical protein